MKGVSRKRSYVTSLSAAIMNHCWITYQQWSINRIVANNYSNYQQWFITTAAADRILINSGSKLESLLIIANNINNGYKLELLLIFLAP
jgi:hypothetical protein